MPRPIALSRQLVVVTTSSWNAVDGALQRYQRSSPRQAWRPFGSSIAVVVGKAGMGWGIGAIHIPASARSKNDPVKREGDNRSPAGIFRFGTAFGYAPQPPASWKIPYLPIVPTTHCVDDSHSRYYNRIVDSSKVPPDWNSSESMRYAGVYYRWGVVIDQNTPHPLPEAGSCVFMHVWAGPGIGTVGCTAMPEPQLKTILAWLDPEAKPLLVEMPIARYRRIRKSMHLPLRPSISPHREPTSARSRI
ncbi:MAG TPA: L,D-transpeptidase family protein [Acidobacteriaceae bacterium]|nr:L,D-transpeptidase family protein [Acidobacteriaceae bacterium]